MSNFNDPKAKVDDQIPALEADSFQAGARFRPATETLNAEAEVPFNDGSRFYLDSTAVPADVHVLPGAAGAQVGGASEIVRRPAGLLRMAEAEQVGSSNHNAEPRDPFNRVK